MGKVTSKIPGLEQFYRFRHYGKLLSKLLDPVLAHVVYHPANPGTVAHLHGVIRI